MFESLKNSKEFRFVYQNGTSYANRYLVMYVTENHLGKNRLGISVSKKVGNSVVRHRLTRLVRESFRLHQREFSKASEQAAGNDIVIVARVAAKGKNYQDTEVKAIHISWPFIYYILDQSSVVTLIAFQRRMGSDYHAEVFLRHLVETGDYTIVIEGRADGIITQREGAISEVPELAVEESRPAYDDLVTVTIDEIKGTYREVYKIKEAVPVHLAQAQCYAYIYGIQNNLKNIRIRITYCNIDTEEIKYFHP